MRRKVLRRKEKLQAAQSAPQRKQKRAPTGYSVFVQENYASFQQAIASEPTTTTSKDVLASLARHWQILEDEEKRRWSQKAKERSDAPTADSTPPAVDPVEEPELPEPPETWPDRKPPPKLQDDHEEEDHGEDSPDGPPHI